MAPTIDPKLIIIASMALPVAYIFFEWEFTRWALVGLAGFAYYNFDNQFINKADIERKEPRPLGPQEPFRSPEKEWEIGADGTPVPKFQPPQGQYPYKR